MSYRRRDIVTLSHVVLFTSYSCCLQADIMDVNQIFKDLAVMIHDQGDMIGKSEETYTLQLL